MGKLSDQRRSARRPGKRERVRAKKSGRSECGLYVGGAGMFNAKAGRKKLGKVTRFGRRLLESHLVGESLTPKSAVTIRRPLYTIVIGHPFQSQRETP